jgi:hypothetical protein
VDVVTDSIQTILFMYGVVFAIAMGVAVLVKVLAVGVDKLGRGD